MYRLARKYIQLKPDFGQEKSRAAANSRIPATAYPADSFSFSISAGTTSKISPTIP